MEKFTVTANRIQHNENHGFTAHWVNGEIKASEDNSESYYYEGSGEHDSLLIYKISWQNDRPDSDQFNCLMDEAITAIDYWIAQRF